MRFNLPVFGLLVLAACGTGKIYVGDPNPNLDQDGDGVTIGEGDCDDSDSNQYPGATEWCDGVDNDCDGLVDNNRECNEEEGDEDGDGHVSIEAGGDDCDDTNPEIHPEADETCDEQDNDCDGEIDEGFDADGDGHLDLSQCAHGDDCNDADPDVHPGVQELCGDGLDQDCNPANDSQGSDWYEDGDGDGFGLETVILTQCEQPEGYVLQAGDCDDDLDHVFPGADEICDNLDQDCDGNVDEDPVEGPIWYLDADDDTFGTSASTQIACSIPAGYADNAEDCDDGEDSVYPGADEYCNDRDDDCDLGIDEDAVDELTWYRDRDADLYGDDASVTYACDLPADYAALGGDCDDYDSTINPGAPETYGDGIDSDCDGTDGVIWYISGSSFCVSEVVFSATHADCGDDGAYLVGSIPFDPWDEIDVANYVALGAVDPGFYCYDFSVRAAGTFETRLIGACDVNSPTDPVDAFDDATWEWADYDSYCEWYDAASPDSLGICHDSSFVSGFTARITHDGAGGITGAGTL